MIRHGGFLGGFTFPRLCAGVLAGLALFCSQTGGFAAETAGSSLKQNVLQSDSPLHIASDRMEAKQKEKTILFEGHVQVRQDDLTITGNQMRVYAAEAKKGAKPGDPAMMDQIDRIEVEGNVKITQKEKMATAEKAVYYHQTRKIVLMGNPSVAQGQDKVAGRLITLYLNEERSVVEGSEGTPVQAVLHPARKE
jgi:lipopolysaccharide export system protein LptA